MKILDFLPWIPFIGIYYVLGKYNSYFQRTKSGVFWAVNGAYHGATIPTFVVFICKTYY